MTSLPESCHLCPRACGADRRRTRGACGAGAEIEAARASLHLWEEPVISGEKGSGTVFFSHCSLGCVFCQNGRISHENFGKVITPAHLREIMEGLVSQGAHCIDLVTPTHFTPWVLEALKEPLPVPVVWNSGGYERVETLRTLEGKVQIYLPDLKYAMERPARELSAAPDYFEVAAAAIDEMVRQVGAYQIGDDGLMRSGVILRHLVLPLIVMVASHLWYYAYMIRNKLLDEIRRDYVLLARAKGLGRTRVLLSHCLRNVLPTIVSIMAISIPHVLSGTYVAESVFNYPGIGLLAVSSAKYHDYNLLMLMVLITGAMVMLSSLVAQAVNEVIDPRMKSSDGVVC